MDLQGGTCVGKITIHVHGLDATENNRPLRIYRLLISGNGETEDDLKFLNCKRRQVTVKWQKQNYT